MASNSHRLIVFVKAPRPGTVKTRLAQSLGVAVACEAYQQLIATLLGRIAPLECVQLRYSPGDALPEIASWVRAGWDAVAQGDGDLGERLARAFREAFESGCRRVVVIGSDCPWMDAEDVRRAWDALEADDVVLGPAMDGGYWLIGLKAPATGLFQGIEWSSGSVFSQTLEQARWGGLTVHRLRELEDVDTEAAWRRFQEKFNPSRRSSRSGGRS
jgi:rSAM/selenodomain-associated transferase 1